MTMPLRVLLVEDSPADAELLQLRLERGGLQPTLTRVMTGEAMRAALADAAGWDLVLADYQLPRFGGLEAIRLVRESGLDLPIIVVSGVIGEEAAVAALKAGAHDFVRKDNMARLVPAIERELREAAERRARRVAEEAVREHNERQRLLAELAPVFAEAILDYRRLLALIGERLAGLLDAVGFILLRPEEGEQDEAPVVFGADALRVASLRRGLTVHPPSPTESLPYTVLREGQAVVISQAQLPESIRTAEPTWQEWGRANGVATLFFVPMRARGRTLGVAGLMRFQGGAGEFREADRRLAQDLADRAALAIDNARLYAHLEERVAQRTAELQAANTRLQALDVLKGNFVNSVSHELRTPLTTIMGYAEFLEDEVAGPLTADQRTFVAQIQRSTARLQRLVDDLLDFARMDAGTFTLRREPCDVCEKVEAVAESLRPQVTEAKLQLHVACTAQRVPVLVDAQRLEQVITNLLTNAIKFTPAGGAITVTVLRAGAELRVEVRDTGVGIAPADVPRLFHRFAQLDTLKGGTGLGLSISHALIEAHGGRMGVESEPGEGSCFWFTLPLAPPDQK